VNSIPSVSIVTVTLNEETGLRRTWTSIESQTLNDFQWVVVDGMSFDGTRDWLASLSDVRVEWRSEEDDGIYDAMNKGLSDCRGELVVFLNAGDRLAHSTVLERVCASRRLERWAWAYGRIRVVDQNGRTLRVQRFQPFSLGLLRLGVKSVPHPAAFFERDLLRRVGPYRVDLGLVADQELMLRVARCSQPKVLATVLADFAQGGVSWGRRPDAFVREARSVRSRTGDLLRPRALDDLLTAVLSFAKRTQWRLWRHVRGTDTPW
jgi:glycosyltransferase involved in cell wall biosynthesis